MRWIRASRFAAYCLLALLLLVRTTAAQPPLRVLSSNGVRAPLQESEEVIEAAIGAEIDLEFSTSASLADRIEAGEPFDVAILTPTLIERLQRSGRIAADPTTRFARTGVGVGARPSASARDVSSVEALSRTLLAAESIALTADGQSRCVSEAAFETLGIAAQLAPKIVLLGPGEGPYAVARGEAELVLTLISEIVPVTGIELIGPFPEEVQAYVDFEAALSAAAASKPAAQRFLAELRVTALADALRRQGLETIGD